MIRLIVSFSDAGAMANGCGDMTDRWSEIFEIEHKGLEEALTRKMPYATRSLTHEIKPEPENG